MLLTLLLTLAFVTVAALVWAVMGAPGSAVGGRFMRYATGAGTVEANFTPTPKIKMPRAWEAFLARSGVDWTFPQLIAVICVHAAIGTIALSFVGLPLLGVPLGAAFLYGRLLFGQKKRVQKMAEQLPDALMLMASALKSGLGFQQALQMVGKEGAAPLSHEFGRFANDLSLGLSIEEALVRLQTRLGSIDGEMLASALLVQRQTGGNLSEILRNLHDTIRDRQQVIGQVNTLTAMGRMSGVILTAIPFFLAGAIYTMNRDYVMVLITDPRGQMMVAASFVMLLMGAFVIRRIVNITL